MTGRSPCSHPCSQYWVSEGRALPYGSLASLAVAVANRVALVGITRLATHFFFPIDMGFVGVSVWGSGSDRLRRVPSGACLYGRRASMREGISTIYQPA